MNDYDRGGDGDHLPKDEVDRANRVLLQLILGVVLIAVIFYGIGYLITGGK